MEGKHKQHTSLGLWQAVMNAGECVTGMRIPSSIIKKGYFFL